MPGRSLANSASAIACSSNINNREVNASHAKVKSVVPFKVKRAKFVIQVLRFHFNSQFV